MAKTLVDVDEDRLAEAKELLGTSTKKDTINAALGEVVAAAARRRELARLASGQLAELADPEARARAWQR
ncbi:MAG: type II toxin-antitoxin system VapB family antitoxin [Acidimicrobiia bacterium]